MNEKGVSRKSQPFFPDLGKGWVPLEALTIIKCLDPTGVVRYREMTSASLHPVEALGMLTTMADTMRARLMSSARGTDDD